MLIEEEDPIRGATSPHIREKRIEIIKGITQQAALAIKNDLLLRDALRSEKIEREFQLAREIQQAFLPDSIPYIPGWDIDVRWQPARQVGGDFYDLLYLDDTHLGIVIADVADKGMPAALFMTLIRTLIRSAAKEITSPAGVLKQVNELLFQDAKSGMFVTVFYGVFDIKSGRVIYANAGHNPPIRKTNQSSRLDELTRTSMALGLFYDIEVDERELFLLKDDLLLLYTDGITEAFSETEEMFGTQRLFDILYESYPTSKQVLDVIESAVNAFIGRAEISDDLTLVAIYRKM
jgi:serine phosphatase RsbU (regulator of sigma subunit)